MHNALRQRLPRGLRDPRSPPPPEPYYRVPSLVEGFFATIVQEILLHRANPGAGVVRDFCLKVQAHARRFKAKTDDVELHRKFDDIAARVIANAQAHGIDTLFRKTINDRFN